MSSRTIIATPTKDLSQPPRPLRRLTFELFAIITLKITVLLLLWWLVFAPQPKPDTSAGAMAQRFAPSSHVTPEAQP
ncbi:MAG: cytochrome oxidase putative small subunit CydP [Rhodanobacter sp.]